MFDTGERVTGTMSVFDADFDELTPVLRSRGRLPASCGGVTALQSHLAENGELAWFSKRKVVCWVVPDAHAHRNIGPVLDDIV